MSAAVEVTMNEILNPTPVSVTTPTTIPTVAAAAPTASAYLAPSRRSPTIWPTLIRLPGLNSPTRMHSVMPQKAAI